MTTFSDNFDRADGPVGSGWVQVSGTWTIASDLLSPGSSGSTVVLRAAASMATSDNAAQITIAATTPVSQGVWCRGDSTLNNGYVLRSDGTTWALFKVISGTFTSLGTYAAAVAAGDIAKVQAVGSTITGTINGAARITLTDTSVTSGTSVGLRCMSTSGLKFNDFIAGDVVTGATLGIASSVDAAQALTGGKTAVLGIAAEADAAQTLSGAKAASAAVAAAIEAAQPLAGLVTAALGTTAAAETALPLTGSMSATLGTALEGAAAQAPVGAKTAPLPGTAQTEIALPFTGAMSRNLGTAMETSTARPLSTATAGRDIDITVGAPYSCWTVTLQASTWTGSISSR